MGKLHTPNDPKSKVDGRRIEEIEREKNTEKREWYFAYGSK